MDNKIALTAPQKRFLSSCLISFEKSLRLTERLLKEDGETGILYFMKQPLSAGVRQKAQKRINKVLQELDNLVKKLDLEPIEERMERIIMAELSVSWADLMDARSKRLRGYGDIDPRIVEILDPGIESLSRAAMELNQLILSDMEDAPYEE